MTWRFFSPLIWRAVFVSVTMIVAVCSQRVQAAPQWPPEPIDSADVARPRIPTAITPRPADAALQQIAERTMQQNVPSPGPRSFVPQTYREECRGFALTEEQRSALRQVIAEKLNARGGSIEDFDTSRPSDCPRAEANYYLNVLVELSR